MPKNIVEMINALNTQHKYAIADAVNSIETSSGARNAIADAIHNIEMSGGGEDSNIFDIETGEWTPDENVTRPTIPFNNRHAKMPFLILFADTQQVYPSSTTLQWEMTMVYFDFYQLFGVSYPHNYGTERRYSMIAGMYKQNNMQVMTSDITLREDDATQTADVNYPRYYTSENEFYPKVPGVSSVFWKAGHSHKWVALWLK